MDAPVMRSLPQSIEAEQMVLGSMIIDKYAIAKAAEFLKAEDFYRDSHKTIYSSIMEMVQKDEPVDEITLLEHLKATDRLEKAGGITYVTEISNAVPSTANLTAYIKIVEEKSLLRKLIRSSTDIIEDCYNKQDDVVKVIDSAEKRVFDIGEKRNTGEYEALSDVLERSFAEIERLFNNKGEITGVGSGFTKGRYGSCCCKTIYGKDYFCT